MCGPAAMPIVAGVKRPDNGSGDRQRVRAWAKRSVELAPSKKHGGELMNLSELSRVAEAMVAPRRGILAADESSGTIKKRFDAIGVENTEANRRAYREMMFRTSEAMSKNISGVILYDETLWQKAKA